ncbi:hypothetical protein LguiB_026607 [Lonicera macranthoides]
MSIDPYRLNDSRQVTRRKQRELLHSSAGGRSSNKYSVSPRSIHEEEGSSLTEENFFQEEEKKNKEKMKYGENGMRINN